MKTKKQRSMAAVLVSALLLGTLSIPGGTVSHAASKLKATAPKTVAVNQTVTIKTNVKAKFKSSNKKIATVSSKGVVKGKKAGKVKITVTSKSNKNQKKTVTITVQNKLVITEPANAKAALKVGETVKIKTNLSSKFSSSNDSVAQVSSNGTVTAKSKGTATITVTAKKYKNLVKKVTITVEEQAESTTKVPTTEKPKSEVPTTEKPTSEDKITEKPTSEQPEIETPTSELTTEDTSDGEIIIISEEPTSEEPTTEKPTTEGPTTETPSPEVTTNEVLEVQAKGISPNEWGLDEHGFIVYLKSNDGTSKRLGYDEYTVEYTNTIEENSRKYEEYKISYKNLEEDIRVEVIEIPDNIMYAVGIYGDYDGTIVKGTKPEFDKIKGLSLDFGNLKYSDASIRNIEDYESLIDYGFSFGDNSYDDLKLNMDNLYWGKIDERTYAGYYELVYDYYFEYEGVMFYETAYGELKIYYTD